MEVPNFIFGFIAGIILGFLLGGVLSQYGWEKQAVEKGFAEYNTKTAKWQWKEDKK
jgi:hypothetical protein